MVDQNSMAVEVSWSDLQHGLGRSLSSASSACRHNRSEALAVRLHAAEQEIMLQTTRLDCKSYYSPFNGVT